MWQSLLRPSHFLLTALRRSPLLLRLSCIAPLVIVGSLLAPQLVQAESPTLISLQFPKSTGDAPRRTAGAGVRGAPACITNHPDQTLVALMPNDRVSLTLSGQPSFFVFIPPNTAAEGVFELYLDENHYGSYIERITLSGDPGLVQVTVPPEISLKTEEDYFWRFSLICDQKSPENNAIVQGSVRRTELAPEVIAELEALPEGSLDRAKFYAENRIWHEATAMLYDMQENAPDEWSEWLGSVHLGFLMDEPSALTSSPTLF
ncbi:DUF928 domain-containing protein [Prochlorothrix hollandica]|uniref:DUF928 domain-containing protein n=1 Tax=Prochlorothrix hollandica TaxID=1223 RepID=UPI003340807B